MPLPPDPRVPGGSTYDRAAVINVITEFYRFLASMPYVKPEDILYPPTDGWPLITRELIVEHYKKSEEVYQLLKHLPYLPEDRGFAQGHLLKPYTELCDFHEPKPDNDLWDNSISPEHVTLPAWAVPLAFQTEGQFGSYVVLDVTDGTITEMGFDAHHADHDVYADDDPRAWRNKAQVQHGSAAGSTLPAEAYFRNAADRFRKLEFIGYPEPHWPRLVQTDGAADEDEARKGQALQKIYREHGWPDAFNRAACDAAVRKWIKEDEEQAAEVRRRQLDQLLAAQRSS